MLTWKDATSFSRDETDRTPRVYEARADRFRLVIHRWHGIPGWFFTCHPGLFDKHPLEAETPSELFREASNLFTTELNRALTAIK